MKLTLLLAKVLLIVSSAVPQSEWCWQNPLSQGNDLYCTQFIDLNTGYAVGSAGTFMKTTNAGVNWNTKFHIAGVTGNIPITSVAIKNNSEIYISIDKKILRTTDDGISWDTVAISLYRAQRTIFFCNDMTGYSFACDNNSTYGQVFKTTNGGANFFLVNTGSEALNTCYFINSNTGWAAGWHYIGGPFSYGSYISKTTNGGVNWTAQLQSGSYPMNSIFFINENTGWAAGEYLWKTTDGGNSWSYQNISANCVRFINSITGFYLSSDGIYKTTNGGDNWNIKSSVGGDYLNIIDNDRMYYVGKFGMICKSIDGGNNWNRLSNYVISDNIQSISIPGNNAAYAVWLGGTVFNPRGGVIKSTNEGREWNIVHQDNSNFLYEQFFIDENTGWITGPGIIKKTTDGGMSWVQKSLGSSSSTGKLFFLNSSTGWMTSTGGNDTYSLKTTNGGDNWTAYRAWDYIFGITQIHFFDPYNGIIISGINSLITTNGGSNWQSYPNTYSFRGSCSDNSGNLFAINYNQIYKSSDRGITWQLRSLYSGEGFVINMVNPNTGYIGGLNGFLSKTTNGGVNWVKQNSMTGLQIRSIATIDTSAWAAGDNGMIISTNGSGTTGIVKMINNVPAGFLLYQNYPNPFNPSTIINYQCSRINYVTLKVYNALGKEVATLVNENKPPGNYSVQFDGSNFASGVYYYKLKAGEFSDVKKMVLLK